MDDKNNEQFPEPYRLADQAIRALNRYIVRRFAQAERLMQIAGFDELNVIQTIQETYQAMDSRNRSTYKKLYRARFEELLEYLIFILGYDAEVPDDKELAERAEQGVRERLYRLDSVTRYIYDNEVLRKRERVTEGVNAAAAAQDKEAELRKGMRFWSQMSQQYADEISDDAALAAMREAGVQYIMWLTQADEKVCKKCNVLDGQIMPIEEALDKVHWRCRCYFVPVSGPDAAGQI